MTGGWILIPNWPKFQHYWDRDPVWIKLYLDLRSREEWVQLTLAERGLLVSLWVEYAASDGLIRHSDIPRRVAQKVRIHMLDALVEAGFVEISASRPLALTRARALAREEKRREDPQTPKRKRKTKTAGDRIEALIRNGVITDPIALEAELRGEGLNSDLAERLRGMLRPI